MMRRNSNRNDNDSDDAALREAQTKVVVLLDRLVSATSAKDAVESLQGLMDGLDQKQFQVEWMWNHPDRPLVLEHLVHVLQHASLKPPEDHDTSRNIDVDDDAVLLVCQLYQKHLWKEHAMDCLTQPHKGALLEALLDVMDRPSHQMYTRVVALQLMHDLSHARYASTITPQWLHAPNGLHRLADLITLPGQEDVLRSQALLVAQRVASSQTSMAKVFLFAELEVHLLDLSWTVGGGITKGEALVLESLRLIHTLVEQADASLLDLIWQRPSVGPRLAQLLDLRGGDVFLHPKDYPSLTSGQTKTSNDDEGDDLDALLQSTTKAPLDGPAETKKEKDDDSFLPMLLPSEEEVVSRVLDIVEHLLSVESMRPALYQAQGGLFSLVWELALVSPSFPPVCALPSLQLQQRALQVVATSLASKEFMEKHAGLDRLCFLVCTGGRSKTTEEALGMSQAALSVLRAILTPDQIHQVLLHTLAPPPMIMEEDDGKEAVALPIPGPTVVQKLWGTIREQLATSGTTSNSKESTVFWTGALGGLGLFFCDVESKEMVLRTIPTPDTMESLLHVLLQKDNNLSRTVQWSIWRFVCEWIQSSPLLVQTLLSSPSSTNLATVAADATKSGKKDGPRPSSMVFLALGLCLETMLLDQKTSTAKPTNDSGGAGNDEKYGGWTLGSITDLLQSVGMANVTAQLESLKSLRAPPTKEQTVDVAWFTSSLEQKVWNEWCKKAVWSVRKCLVQSLSHSSDAAGGASEDPSSWEANPQTKTLQHLVQQQTEELETIRLKLDTSEAKVQSQSQQLQTWNRRMESTPTELDRMVTDMTSQTATLTEQIAKLEQQAKSDRSKHEAELSAVKQELEISKTDIQSKEGEVTKAKQEKEGLEQDLNSLSAAYTSLETEYRTQTSRGPATQAAGSPSEDAGSGNEVTTLRAENTRLKENAKAADEWMAMAMQRMKDADASIIEKDQHIAALQTSESTNQSNASRFQEKANQNAESYSKALADEQQRHLETSNQVSALQQELQAKMEESVSNTHQLNEQLVQVQNELRNALASQSSVSAIPRSADGNVDDSPLAAQLEAAQKALADAQHNAQAEIYTKEATIRELGSRLDSGLGGYKVEDIRSRDEEIEELKSAYQAAQEWMSQAVEHDRVLTAQVASLMEENSVLKAELESSNRKGDELATGSDARHLAEQVAEYQARIEQTEAQRVAAVAAVDSSAANLATLRQQLDQSTQEVAMLQIKLEQTEVTVSTSTAANDDTARLNAEKGELETRLGQFQEWATAVEGKLKELMTTKETLETRLQAAELERATVQNTLAATVAERDTLAQQIADTGSRAVPEDESTTTLTAETESDRSVIEQLQAETNQLQLENQRLSSALEEEKKGRAHNSELQEKNAALETSLENTKGLESEKTTLESQLQSQSEEASSWQESYTAIKQKYADYDEQKAELLSLRVDFNSLSQEKTLLESKLTEAEGSIKDADTATSREDERVAEWKDRVSDLEAQLSSLELQLTEQVEENKRSATHWQEQASLNEQKRIELEQTVSELSASTGHQHSVEGGAEDAADFFGQPTESTVVQDPVVKGLETKLKERDEELVGLKATIAQDEQVVDQWKERVDELESNIASLETQLSEQEENAKSVIEQWQSSYAELEVKYAELDDKPVPQKADDQSQPDHSSISDMNASIAQVTTERFMESSASNIDEALQTKLEAAEAELHDLKEIVAQDENVVEQWKERVHELESMNGDLEKQLKEQEDDAANVISQWQTSYSVLEEKCAEFDKIKEELGSLKEQRDTPPSSSNEIAQASEPQSVDRVVAEGLEARISDKEEELRLLQSTIADDEKSLEEWQVRVAQLDSDNTSLESQLKEQEAEANKVISQWQESYAAIEQKCKDFEDQCIELPQLKTELSTLQERCVELEVTELKLAEMQNELTETMATLAENEQLADQWKERAQEMESSSAVLETKLADQEMESKRDILHWQEKYAVIAQNCSDLTQRCNELEAMKEEMADTKQDEASLEGLKSELASKEQDIAKLRSTIADDEHVVDQWKERVEELETSMATLELQMKTQEEEANSVIAQWQASYTAVEKQYTEIQQRCQELEQVEAELESMKNLQTVIAEQTDSIESLKTQLEKKEREMIEIRSSVVEDEEHKETWKARAEEQELHAVTVKSQLAEQIEASGAEIAALKQKSSDIETLKSSEIEEWKEKLNHSEDQLAMSRQEVDHIAELLDETEKRFSREKEGQTEYESAVQDLTDEVTMLQERLSSQEQEANAVIAQWEARLSATEEEGQTIAGIVGDTLGVSSNAQSIAEVVRMLVDQNAKLQEEMTKAVDESNRLKKAIGSKSRQTLEEERDRLTIVISQLEGELRESNNLVQTYITDGSSDRATALAAESLRDEIDTLKSTIQEYKTLLDNAEESQRESQDEIDRLQEDIAALLYHVKENNDYDNVQLLTTTISEKMKLQERSELEQLRQSLQRVLDDLEIAKASQQDSSEKLSRHRLEASVCEQELVSTKSELKMLTTSMEEMRVTEESRRASLEYRIGTLDDENDVLRKYHAGELESIRSELGQAFMEKDRILNQLKESEKDNASLVFAASKGDNIEIDSANVEEEIARLRIENAHLLTVAADDKARAERRLRETLSAQVGQAEADNILEHELRVSAQATIDTMKQEVEELRRHVDNGGSEDPDFLSDAHALNTENNALRVEITELKEEVASAQIKLKEVSERGTVESEALREECRRAQAKAHKLERDGKNEIAIQTEVARLRMLPSLSSPERRALAQEEWTVIANERAAAEGRTATAAGIPSVETFEAIQEQARDIEEERREMRELLVEHEELLAAFADTNEERECLRQALLETGGYEAVMEATAKAQKKVAELGTSIEVH